MTHWLAWLLGACLALSLLIPAIALGIDSRRMDPAEQYSWNGWYIVLIMAGYGATLMTLAGMLLARIVQSLRDVASNAGEVNLLA